jgi:hypothetical protein
MHLFGIGFILAFAISFTYFWVVNFQNMYYVQRFIAASPDSGHCEPVSKPWTIPAITSDYYGYWQGEYDFNPNEAQYLWVIFDFQADIPTFSE